MFNSNINFIAPKQPGWLKAKLSSEPMDRLWFYIQKYTGVENYNQELAGNITSSWFMEDDDNWFYDNVLLKLCRQYADSYKNLGDNYATTKKHLYCLKSFWVNFQKQHEFNPFHMHRESIYSFVIWMKIPYDYREQHRIPICSNSNTPSASNFQFIYTNLLGQTEVYDYFLDESMEGTILFFPSSLCHQVYPFFNCDEKRISISGNIALDTSKFIE
jgi:hypothetical protein